MSRDNNSNYSFVELNLGGEDSTGGKDAVYGNLLNVLKDLLPSSVQMMNLIQVKMRRMFSLDSVKEFRFFSYEPELEKVGITEKMDPSSRDWSDTSRPLFLVCIITTRYEIEGETEFVYRLMYSRDNPSPDDSLLLQRFSNLFNFSIASNVVFGTMDIRYVPFLEKVASLHGRKALVYPNWTMYLPMAKALGFANELKQSSNPSFSIRPLELDHASAINSNWKFGGKPGVLLHMRHQIQHSVSAGIFLVGEQNKDDLVCWVVSMPTGTINALHTRDAWRRKGFAELAMKSISFNLAKGKGMFPLVEVELDSLASKTLMEKLGFELAFDAAWVYCKVV